MAQQRERLHGIPGQAFAGVVYALCWDVALHMIGIDAFIDRFAGDMLQGKTGGQNLFDPADNLESEYACAALVTWFHLLVDGKLKSISHSEFEDRTGLELCDKDGVLKEELPPIQRWLNRILALPIGLQNSIFDEFLSLVETRVSAAREAGRLDVGVETILVDSATLIDDTLLRTDPVSGATSHLLTIEIARRRTPVTLERVLRIADSDSTAVFLLNVVEELVDMIETQRAYEVNSKMISATDEMLKYVNQNI